MIPKKIHYCWFGRNKLSEKAVRCIESWKRYCSDYEIIEWNEDNYDVYQNPDLDFVEYVTGVRMKRARELLLEGGKSIKQICAEIGYSDPNYFSRIFKKYEGCTPTEFREGKV